MKMKLKMLQQRYLFVCRIITDWISVKEITGSNETGWVMNPKLLTDAEY